MIQVVYWSMIVGLGFAFIAIADTKLADVIVRKLFVRRKTR